MSERELTSVEKVLAERVCGMSRHVYLSLQPVPPLSDILMIVVGDMDMQVVMALDVTGPQFDESIADLPLEEEGKAIVRKVKSVESSGLLRVVASLQTGPRRHLICGLRTSVYGAHSA